MIKLRRWPAMRDIPTLVETASGWSAGWQLLEVDDVLDVCDLYRLKLFWPSGIAKGEHAPLDWATRNRCDKFGRYLA